MDISWGDSGMESIHNGIYGLKEKGCDDEDLVLIHDSVRPLLSQEIISSNIAICKAYGYAITGSNAGKLYWKVRMALLRLQVFHVILLFVPKLHKHFD